MNFKKDKSLIKFVRKTFKCYFNLLILSIINSKIINKKLELNNNTVLSVILFELISCIKKKINIENNGKIKGINVLKGL